MTEGRIESLLRFLSFFIFFCVVLQLLGYNGFNTSDWLNPKKESYQFTKVRFFLLRLLFFDDGIVDSDSENFFWSFIGLILFIGSFKSWSSCIVVASNSETAFRVLEIFAKYIFF